MRCRRLEEWEVGMEKSGGREGKRGEAYVDEECDGRGDRERRERRDRINVKGS